MARASARARGLARLPWSHNIALLEDPETRLWYAREVVEQGWSRNTLAAQITSGLHERHGTAQNNFSDTLPPTRTSGAGTSCH